MAPCLVQLLFRSAVQLAGVRRRPELEADRPREQQQQISKSSTDIHNYRPGRPMPRWRRRRKAALDSRLRMYFTKQPEVSPGPI